VLKGHKPALSPWDVPWSATLQMRERWGGENSTQLEKKKEREKNGKEAAVWRLNIMLHREQDKLFSTLMQGRCEATMTVFKKKKPSSLFPELFP